MKRENISRLSFFIFIGGTIGVTVTAPPKVFIRHSEKIPPTCRVDKSDTESTHEETNQHAPHPT